jgi:hypothetical protein
MYHDPALKKAMFATKYGSPKTQSRMAKRGTVIQRITLSHSGPAELLDHMTKDKNSEVRWNVADRGEKRHLDQLVNDKDGDVRAKVAAHGYKDHHAVLSKDKDPKVRYFADNAKKEGLKD